MGVSGCISICAVSLSVTRRFAYNPHIIKNVDIGSEISKLFIRPNNINKIIETITTVQSYKRMRRKLPIRTLGDGLNECRLESQTFGHYESNDINKVRSTLDLR